MVSEAGVGSEAVDPLRPRARPTVWPGRRPGPGIVAPGPPGSTRSRLSPLATSPAAGLRWSVGVGRYGAPKSVPSFRVRHHGSTPPPNGVIPPCASWGRGGFVAPIAESHLGFSEQFLMPPGAAPILMKMGSFGLTLDHANRLRSKAVLTRCFEPVEQFGPDVATIPSLSPSFLGEHAWQTVASVRCPRSGSRPEATMETIYPCCAGLDIHKTTVVAWVRRLDPAGRVHEAVRTFGTMTAELLALADWLAESGVTHVAMESTGVFWKPVFNLLEDRFEVLLVNPRHIKQVPGRKTDVKDCQWIAQLLQHGLLRGSFIPPKPIRELRDLTRQRSQLVAEKAAVANRIPKVLEDANIKLASVATDVLGVSGRAMIAALIGGETEPDRLAELARRRLRRKMPELQAALRGQATEHHRFLLRLLMSHLDSLEGLIATLGARIA